MTKTENKQFVLRDPERHESLKGLREYIIDNKKDWMDDPAYLAQVYRFENSNFGSHYYTVRYYRIKGSLHNDEHSLHGIGSVTFRYDPPTRKMILLHLTRILRVNRRRAARWGRR